MSHKTEWQTYDCIAEFPHCVDDVDGSSREVIVRINSDISVYNDSSLPNEMPDTDDRDDSSDDEEEDARNEGDDGNVESNGYGEGDTIDEAVRKDAKAVSDYGTTKRWNTWKCRVLDIRGKRIPESEGEGMEIFGLLVQYYQRPEDLGCFQNELWNQMALGMKKNELFISNQVDLVEVKSIADVISVAYTPPNAKNGHSGDAAEQEDGYLCTGLLDVYKSQCSKTGTG
ncbi:Hypothetical protein D9617_44g039020 [Elsinoe fawcettii]|nr:Hypothetical protein D9617_44g039020 [Elsinoe fawcettii]